MHHRAWVLVRHGEPDRAGACAEVDNNWRGVALYLREHCVDHDLCLRPRDEHARAYLQVEITEASGAEQMLQRHPLRTSANELVEVRLRLRSMSLECACVVLRTRDASFAQHSDGFVDGHSVPLSAASVSASTNDCTTASRSPSRTWSRL